MEKMSPRDLAAQIKNTQPKNPEKIKKDRSIDDMITIARQIYRCLDSKKFEETPEGHVRLETIDTSDWDYPGKVVSGVKVRYVDTTGYKVDVGTVYGSWMNKPPAIVNTSPYDTEPLFPNDPRWDAVVGAIGRAILTCREQEE